MSAAKHRDRRRPNLPEAIMDWAMAERLARRITAESNLAFTAYENSKGVVVLNVTDPRKNAKDRVKPFTVRNEAEWDEKKPARRRKRENHDAS